MKTGILFFSIFVFHFSSAQNIFLKVADTDFSKGRLIKQQTISLEDAAKFHGHLCDGLLVGFLGLREALYKIYPDSIIDRTNTRIVSKSSPCLTDIAIYLTGGRYQFNTFYVSDSIQFAFIVQRADNGKAFGVKLKPGIKPAAIDSLGYLANAGKLKACDIDVLHELEDQFMSRLLASNVSDLFFIVEISDFKWQPTLANTFIKTDIINKNLPFCIPEKK